MKDYLDKRERGHLLCQKQRLISDFLDRKVSNVALCYIFHSYQIMLCICFCIKSCRFLFLSVDKYIVKMNTHIIELGSLVAQTFYFFYSYIHAEISRGSAEELSTILI